MYTPASNMLSAVAVYALVATMHMHAHQGLAAAQPEYGAYGGYGGDPAPPTAADFVVIGGGTAGCVVAARLCENLPEASVVILERAPPRTEEEELLVRSPRLLFDAWLTPGVSEGWETEPNPGLRGRRIMQFTGRTLGGSSAINGAQWTKPPLATFEDDKWAFSGLNSSTAGDLFRRAESKLQVAVPPPELQHTYLPEYLAAAAAVGLPTVSDPLSRTGPPSDGIWPNVVIADDAGRRVDSYTAYISPVMSEGGACMRNLQLVQSATVSKIVIEGGRAVGVRYLQTDSAGVEQEREIEATKEVLCSAGPYWSPALLQVSGVGPAEVLEGLGVPQVVELPVGESCVARPSNRISELYTAVPLAPEANKSAALAPESIAAFNAGRRGILAVSTGGANGVLALENAYSVFSNVAFPGTPEKSIASYCAINPTARGTLRAASTDPRQPPLADTNFLGSTSDVRNAVACSSRLLAVHDQLRQPLGLQLVFPPPPANGSAVVTEEAMRSTAETFYHYSSGCAVGSVVDGDFRVVGVEGLRVVDASVLPGLPPYAGPMATVYMLAELAAELITAAHE